MSLYLLYLHNTVVERSQTHKTYLASKERRIKQQRKEGNKGNVENVNLKSK